MALPFALNHMTVAKARYDRVLSVASELGCIGVEFRNDLASPLFDSESETKVRQAAKAAGVRILGLSEVKMFNAWNEERANEARALLGIARGIGAETISLIPRCDGKGCGNGERQANLRIALRELLPMLEETGLVGLVEPLGFLHSSLRFKREVVDVITELGGEKSLKLVHDTFHHYLADENDVFAEHTGIVHVSGVEDDGLAMDEIGDEHRVLVGKKDRLGNVAQLRQLCAAGYSGPVSYEAFSPVVHDFADPKSELQASMRYLDEAVSLQAAG